MIGAILITLAAQLLTVGCVDAACDMSHPKAPISVGSHTLNVEIAADPAARRCGLAFRRTLPEDHGMLFVYARSQPLSFWMKDTEIPLSIAFLDADGVVLQIEQMEPLDTTMTYRSVHPARYALETNRGWFSAHGVSVGDRFELSFPATVMVR